MNAELFVKIHSHVFSMLDDLSPALIYHAVSHTEDVVQRADEIFLEEGFTDPNDRFTLKLAALFHDTGFLYCYDDHEMASCAIAQQELPQFGISQQGIDEICTIILATKIPQKPKSKLAEILCDADLDYLGRDDFFSIGALLFHEWMNFKRVNSERDWNTIQCFFLEQHHYFTNTNKKHRAPKKKEHLESVRLLCG